MKTLSNILDTLKTKNSDIQQIVETLRFSRLRFYCIDDTNLHFLVDDTGQSSDLLEREQNIQLLLEEALGCAVLVHTVTAMEDLYASSYEAQAIPLDEEKEAIEQRYKACFGEAPVVFYATEEEEISAEKSSTGDLHLQINNTNVEDARVQIKNANNRGASHVEINNTNVRALHIQINSSNDSEPNLNYDACFDQASIISYTTEEHSGEKYSNAPVPVADFLGNIKRKLGLPEQRQAAEIDFSTASITKALHIQINNLNINDSESHLNFSMPFSGLTRSQKKVIPESQGKLSIKVDSLPSNQSKAQLS